MMLSIGIMDKLVCYLTGDGCICDIIMRKLFLYKITMWHHEYMYIFTHTYISIYLMSIKFKVRVHYLDSVIVYENVSEREKKLKLNCLFL